MVAVESPLQADLNSLNDPTAASGIPNSAPASTGSSIAELASVEASGAPLNDANRATPRSDVSTAGSSSVDGDQAGEGVEAVEQGAVARSVVLRVEHCVWSTYRLTEAETHQGVRSSVEGLQGVETTQATSAEEAVRACVKVRLSACANTWFNST